jgi:hypothetical protein
MPEHGQHYIHGPGKQYIPVHALTNKPRFVSYTWELVWVNILLSYTDHEMKEI